jgi:cellulose synthase/poly-beta-1,6-N-acetylglucosamine synthase-like glycosyltransferase
MSVFAAVVEFIYITAGTILAIHSLVTLLGFLQRRPRRPLLEPLSAPEWPVVTVALPIYNEPLVVKRVLEAAATLDYPREKLQIAVLDDSNDSTSHEIDIKVAELRSRFPDLAICVVRRPERSDFKTGALRESMHLFEGDYIAVFDADFVPEPDFLHKTIPPLVKDAQVGFVQARWTFINTYHRLAAIVQAAALDIHFGIEKPLEQHAHLLINYNGSAGVWRKSAITDSGGWPVSALSEDLELSYRAQVRGWKGVYVEEARAPSELPESLLIFSQQQNRWAFGAVQAFRRLGLAVLRSDLTIPQRMHAFSILLGYSLSVLFIILPASFVFLWLQNIVIVWPMYVLALALLLNYAAAVLAVYRLKGPWAKQLIYSSLFILGSLGIALRVSWGVLLGFFSRRYEFLRTPKTGSGIEANSAHPRVPFRSIPKGYQWVLFSLLEIALAGWYFSSIFRSGIQPLCVPAAVLAVCASGLLMISIGTLAEVVDLRG